MKIFLFLLCTALSFAHSGGCSCQKKDKAMVLQQDSPSTTAERHHILLDCQGCTLDKENISNFAKALGSILGRKSDAAPTLEHFAEGYFLLHFEAGSTITGHFIEKSGNGYIDILSIQYLDPQAATKIAQEHLHPQNIKLRTLARHAQGS